MRTVLMLVNELNVTNTEKLRYKKRMEKHKSTLIQLKTRYSYTTVVYRLRFLTKATVIVGNLFSSTARINI